MDPEEVPCQVTGGGLAEAVIHLNSRHCRDQGPPAGYPGGGGGLWLRMTFPPGLVTWLVPSG